MSNEILRAEHISKLYRLGEINTGTLSHDLNRWWAKLRRRPDPFAKLAEVNDRTSKSKTGYVWSLKDVNFSVNQGDVFAIVGKNGAGKSTLLKILSKITQPTSGNIYLDGKIASLLEVGTGFHPDLSGRDNVFLNGAILGMRKQEIKNRFDEIVTFSGIERYIDTPVKRYSSGMFVRLAFAIAAHLNPEILIIDEVLAVGDAEFQQKCIGKMQDVSRNQGKTVIFVSHNIHAVRQLCNKGMLMNNGEVRLIGSIPDVLEHYQEVEADSSKGMRRNLPDNPAGHFTQWFVLNQQSEDLHSCNNREQFTVAVCFEAFQRIEHCECHLLLRCDDDSILLHTSSADFDRKRFTIEPGKWIFETALDLPVRKGKYRMEIGLLSMGNWVDTWQSTTRLTILDPLDNTTNDVLTGVLSPRTGFSYKGI